MNESAGPADGATEEEPYSYDYADPYEYYGYDEYDEYDEYEVPAEVAEASPEEEYCDWPEGEAIFAEGADWGQTARSGLELFAWHPADLLIPPDQEILRTLETLCEEPSGVRRATFNDYLEGLGMEAIDFASRFEDITGVEVLGLADDLPGAAAFLGSFRLVEQGELGMDEAVDLLEQSLERLSVEWIEGVNEITADAFDNWDGQPASLEDDETADWYDTTSAKNPVVNVMVSLAARSLGGVGGAIWSISRRLSDLPWEALASEVEADRAATHAEAGVEWFQR